MTMNCYTLYLNLQGRQLKPASAEVNLARPIVYLLDIGTIQLLSHAVY